MQESDPVIQFVCVYVCIKEIMIFDGLDTWLTCLSDAAQFVFIDIWMDLHIQIWDEKEYLFSKKSISKLIFKRGTSHSNNQKSVWPLLVSTTLIWIAPGLRTLSVSPFDAVRGSRLPSQHDCTIVLRADVRDLREHDRVSFVWPLLTLKQWPSRLIIVLIIVSIPLLAVRCSSGDDISLTGFRWLRRILMVQGFHPHFCCLCQLIKQAWASIPFSMILSASNCIPNRKGEVTKMLWCCDRV